MAYSATPSRREKVIGYLFLSGLVLVINPFFVLPGAAKFALLFGCTGFALILSDPRRLLVKPFLRWPELIFLVLFLISLLRINSLNDSLFGNEVIIFQICLTIYMMFASLFIAHVIGLDAYTQVIKNFSFLLAGWFILNIGYILDPVSHPGLGDFDKDAYQQVGIIFGLCLIFLANWFKQALRARSKKAIVLFFLLLFFLLLLLMNPARGEMVAAVAAVALILMPRISVLLGFFVLMWPQIIVYLAAMTGFSSLIRLAYFFQSGSGESERAKIFAQALDLLSNNPLVTLFGGGANYFQAVLGTRLGDHPHNIFVETLISGGIFWMLAAIVILLIPVLRGIVRLLLGYNVQALPFALAFFTLIVLSKSGTINSAIIPALFIPYFVHLRKPLRTIEARPQSAVRKEGIA